MGQDKEGALFVPKYKSSMTEFGRVNYFLMKKVTEHRAVDFIFIRFPNQVFLVPTMNYIFSCP